MSEFTGLASQEPASHTLRCQPRDGCGQARGDGKGAWDVHGEAGVLSEDVGMPFAQIIKMYPGSSIEREAAGSRVALQRTHRSPKNLLAPICNLFLRYLPFLFVGSNTGRLATRPQVSKCTSVRLSHAPGTAEHQPLPSTLETTNHIHAHCMRPRAILSRTQVHNPRYRTAGSRTEQSSGGVHGGHIDAEVAWRCQRGMVPASPLSTALRGKF
jgi:hypothetical protein